MSIGIGLNELELVIYLIFVYHSNSSLQRGKDFGKIITGWCDQIV